MYVLLMLLVSTLELIICVEVAENLRMKKWAVALYFPISFLSNFAIATTLS